MMISRGGCLCGLVKFEVKGKLRNVVNCHCRMCQKLHGSFGPHTKAQKENVNLIIEDGLTWYESSSVARRGFCRYCGSGLFWDHNDQDSIGILAGVLEHPTCLKTIGHIFVSEKSDFYEITDDEPQFKQSSEGAFEGDYK